MALTDHWPGLLVSVQALRLLLSHPSLTDPAVLIVVAVVVIIEAEDVDAPIEVAAAAADITGEANPVTLSNRGRMGKSPNQHPNNNNFRISAFHPRRSSPKDRILHHYLSSTEAPPASKQRRPHHSHSPLGLKTWPKTLCPRHLPSSNSSSHNPKMRRILHSTTPHFLRHYSNCKGRVRPRTANGLLSKGGLVRIKDPSEVEAIDAVSSP